MSSLDDDEVSPFFNNTFVSRYLMRPQFSIPEGPNAGKAIPSTGKNRYVNIINMFYEQS